MALTATVYHLKIDFSDVDRAVYQSFDLRLARHPSETMRHMVMRVLAYCLCHEEGIAFSKGGLSSTDEPALSIRDLQGNLRAWIEVGAPSGDRLHKAAKASPRVVIFTHGDAAAVRKAVGDKTIHRGDQIEIYVLESAFIAALEGATDRNAKWELVHTEGQLYATVAGQSFTGAVTREPLAPAALVPTG